MSHPTLMNLPMPMPYSDTPEMPGTPTSTTTSHSTLSALSTTAIKDGHRGHLPYPSRGHRHNNSTNSLEAERADRISRLAGMSSVNTLRAPAGAGSAAAGVANGEPASSPQTTPTPTTGFPLGAPGLVGGGGVAPAYFDAAGQPVALTKMSTVGTASATDSMRTAGADDDALSTYTNAQSRGTAEGDSSSALDDDNLTAPSLDESDDRLSDDGNASLVGFGEGAGSTLSGPIYYRRPIPGTAASAIASHRGVLELTTSGLSDSPRSGPSRGGGGGYAARPGSCRESDTTSSHGSSSHTAADANADADAGEAWMNAPEQPPAAGPVQPLVSAIRETQQPGSHQQQPQAQYPGSTSREVVERILREQRLDAVEGQGQG